MDIYFFFIYLSEIFLFLSFQYKHAVYVQVCKLFADLERLRQERETKAMHERSVHKMS